MAINFQKMLGRKGVQVFEIVTPSGHMCICLV
jgi:hypothetical protein